MPEYDGENEVADALLANVALKQKVNLRIYLKEVQAYLREHAPERIPSNWK